MRRIKTHRAFVIASTTTIDEPTAHGICKPCARLRPVIKLASVAADVFGTSGRLMLRVLMPGKSTPQEIAELAKKKLSSKIPELEVATRERSTKTIVFA